jgi:anti-sigma28 factor (negative regulator of flagellin synthesis)
LTLDDIICREEYMEIGPVGGVPDTGRINGKGPEKVSERPKIPKKDSLDKVEISRVGEFLSKILGLPRIRKDKVAQIRKQLEEGTYETDEKLSAAIENLLRENRDLF